MSFTKDYIASPKGEIQFLALNRKVAKDMKPDSAEGYAVRLKFDSTTEEGAKWKETISKINPNLIGTKHVDKNTEFTVRAFSKFLPEVLDGKGECVEDMPNFYKESKGVATMVVQPYLGNSMGGSITLSAVVIHEIDVGEYTGSEEGGDTNGNREGILAALKDALKKD